MGSQHVPLTIVDGEVVAVGDKKSEIESALARVHHAISNAQDWHRSEPGDSELDRDQQIGNWIDVALQDINETKKLLGIDLFKKYS